MSPREGTGVSTIFWWLILRDGAVAPSQDDVVIARSEAAKQSRVVGMVLDCFAPLAMTRSAVCLDLRRACDLTSPRKRGEVRTSGELHADHLLPHVPGRETSVSLLVMNSNSTGMPACVFSMPRLIAGTISSGFVMRSPWPPKARAIAA
jgi:hypothetical protein